MNAPDDELPFNGLTLEQRHKAALKQTTAVVKALVPFLLSIQRGDSRLQRETVERCLHATRDLLKTLLLDQQLAAGIFHKFGPPLPEDAPEDALNLRAIHEEHFVLDWLAEIAPLDSIDAGRADLLRLGERHAPRTLRRDHYVDPRTRDGLELADREFAVLLTHFVAGAQAIAVPLLLERLSVGASYDAFRKWARGVELEQRELMTEAGRLETAGGGLPLAQAARLSKRSQDVLLRNDQDRFPHLAGLSDEDKLSKLFALVQRSGPFSRT